MTGGARARLMHKSPTHNLLPPRHVRFARHRRSHVLQLSSPPFDPRVDNLRSRSPLSVEEGAALDSYVGHGTERFDLSKAILIGGMWSRDERSAHLRTVPARFDSEAGRFRRVNATRAQICHEVSLFERFAIRYAECRSAFNPRRRHYRAFQSCRERYRQPGAALAVAGRKL